MLNNQFTSDSLSRPSILVVDDSPDNLMLMSGLLKDTYRVKVANSGDKALKIAFGESPPDLILLDIMMPEIDGYEVCRQLRQNPVTQNIPVIFLTAKASAEDEAYGLELGAVDYITKPISPPIVAARVKTHLALKESADYLRDKAEYLENEVSKRTGEIRAIQDVTILAMATLAETRDSDTGYHIRRTQFYVRALAEKLKNEPKYRQLLTDSYIELLFKSAPLHDIGKVGIPDRILLKPAPLDEAEFEIMKTHAELGRHAIQVAEDHLGTSVDFLKTAKEIAYCHHEKWDGSGYPQNLVAEQIPLAARLMALADVYDALISRRVYKEPIPHEEAVYMIAAKAGKHFDPALVDAFLEVKEQFSEIARHYEDKR